MQAFTLPLTALVVGFCPFAVMLCLLYKRKKRYLERALAPFTDMPLRPPGESTRLQIQTLEEEYEGSGLTLLLASVVAVTTLIVVSERYFPITLAVVAVALLLLYSIIVPKTLRLVDQIRNYRLGFTGERVVGEHLNQLLADGFHVFHDIHFGNYNIDHVIVGPAGVYAVETKTRRKPADCPPNERATVEYDGHALHFPNWRDESFVVQTRRNAKSLSSWLTNATGEPVAVQAILTLPGWFVHRRAISDVNVLNPLEIARCFPSKFKSVLTPQQIQRIVYQLTEHCRLETPHEAIRLEQKFCRKRRSTITARARSPQSIN